MALSNNHATYLSHLYVKDFRNLGELDLSFSPKSNLLVGKNGHGKTNCLEAIALSCSLKPLQPLKNAEMIRFEQELSTINATFSHNYSLTVDIEIHQAGKKAKINGKQTRSKDKLNQEIAVVSFIPEELNMISGSATLRRKALDQATNALFFAAYNSYKDYEKALIHRNKILKSWPIDKSLLDTFTHLLIKGGAQVVHNRLMTIAKLKPYFTENLCKILGDDHFANIEYVLKKETLNMMSVEDLESLLQNKYQTLAKEELSKKTTLFGPHLHDLNFFINNINSKNHSSRGQSRAIVLAFKLAQMLAIHDIRNICPIILLDDIVSELDHNKKQNLIATIEKIKAQTFFTTTDQKTFTGSADKIFRLESGTIATF